jgi:hypothetical protein
MLLPIEVFAFRRNVRRAIFGPGTLESTAFEREELCPSEQVEVSPAIYLPGQLERVTASTPESTQKREIELVTARTITHAPTVAYHIRNAVLFDGSIYSGRLRYPLVDRHTFVSKRTELDHLSKAALASSLLGHRYFGHWLTDDCPTYLLAERFARPLSIPHSFQLVPHAADYQKCFGQDWRYIDRAQIEHLVVFQDFAQNSLKRSRYIELNRRIARTVSIVQAKSSPLVYLRRGVTGAPRLVENEFEIIDVLSKKGFRVVDVENRNLASIREDLAGAEVVVSVEGSHSTHFAFCAPQRSCLLVLQPQDRFTAMQRGWTMCLGTKFGFVVGERGKSGYVFSSHEILQTLDLLIRH